MLAGCHVEATVDVAIEADGSGTVSFEAVFDAESTAAIAGLESASVEDLVGAGWTVTRPQVGADGSTTIRAAKHVDSADQLAGVLDEIAGPGVFGDVRLVSSDEFARRQQSLRFDVDLGRGWSLFSDERVAAALGGEPFGVPIAELTGGRTLDELVTVSVGAEVAGDDADVAAAVVVAPRFDDGEPTTVRVASTTERTVAVLLRWIAWALSSLFVLSVVLAGTGLWLQRRVDRLRPKPPAGLASRIPGAAQPRPSGRSPRTVASAARVQLVVVEPLTVLFQQGGPIENYVLRFVRHNGGEARADAILEAHASLVRGRIGTDEFWAVAQLPPEVADADEVYTDMRWLRKEAGAMLSDLDRRGVGIAAVSNDAAEWSVRVRRRDRLAQVQPWLVSGEVGAAKPDTGMFERLRRDTGVAYRQCLYIDTSIEHLDAARDLGMQTALYNADDFDLPPIVGHRVIKSLAQLPRLL